MTTSSVVVAAFLPQLAGSFAQHLRALHDPLASVLPPHLTLVFPLAFQQDVQVLREPIARVLGMHAPIALRLDEVTAHAELLFLNVKRGNDALIALHDDLYARVFPQALDAEFTFVPHVTVGRVPEQEARRRALQHARSISHPLEVTIEQLSVYVRNDHTGVRHVAYEVPLGRT